VSRRPQRSEAKWRIFSLLDDNSRRGKRGNTFIAPQDVRHGWFKYRTSRAGRPSVTHCQKKMHF